MARRLIEARYTGRAFRPMTVRTVMLNATRDIELAAADYALWRVKSYNAADFKRPTGAYKSRLHVERRSLHPIVTDSGVIYGPWLEGVGRRNAATRFKGYHHWRRATQDLQRAITRIAEQVLTRALRGLS